MAEEKGILTYKGHPLMRKDNLIYYGSMADSHIVMLQVLESKKVNDLDVATRVSVPAAHRTHRPQPGPGGEKERKARSLQRPGCGLCLAGAGSGR